MDSGEPTDIFKDKDIFSKSSNSVISWILIRIWQVQRIVFFFKKTKNIT